MPGPGQSSVTRSLATTGTETRAGHCRYIYTIYTIYIYMLLGTFISALSLCVLELYVLILIVM